MNQREQPLWRRVFFSSSVDWSIKLWQYRPHDALRPLLPLHTFSSSRDYVLDVRWSPTNPALFASANARGTVCLWNVNSESEAPIASLNLSDSAVNKIQWSSNGKKIAAGDSSGKVSILGVSSEYANAHDWTRLGETITKLKRQG